MRLFIIFIFCLSAGLLTGQQSVVQQLDSLVTSAVESVNFSGVVFVARQGEVLLHRAEGMAYYQADDTMETDTRFSIASVTKLFTAVTILQLREEGKLDLQDKLSLHLPELEIPRATEISVADLLLHNAGLPTERATIYQQPVHPEEYVRKTLKNRAKVKYGEYNYNNLDYVLLGLIVEKLRVASWKKVVADRILAPTGMTNTGFLAYGRYPTNFAYTYKGGVSGKLRQDPFFYIENFYAAASMYSTAEDLWLFDQALNTSALLSAESREILAKEFPTNNYAGYSVWNYRYPYVQERPQVMERRGGILGANVVMVRIPQDDTCIIILSNTDAFNPDSFGDPHNLREAMIRALYTPVPLTNH